MTEYRFTDVSSALPTLMEAVLAGEEIGSRAGRVKEILFPHIVITKPWRREMLHPWRKASLPAQIAETMWVLAGRDDVAWLSHYMPRAVEFSDDGEIWRGAYGPRLRRWLSQDGRLYTDQLSWVVDLLKKEPATRRAVMSIYDPARDSQDGKDIPCNNWIQFISRLGSLHMHVTIRSNDLMWGWSGINTFEWSALQEIVAGLTGQSIGELHFSISSLHLYDRHWKKAQDIADNPSTVIPFGATSPRFDPSRLVDRDNDLMGTALENFDLWVKEWFKIEEDLRLNPDQDSTAVLETLAEFPEPMLRSWLQVIAWHWSGDEAYREPLLGTGLWFGATFSPRSERRDEMHIKTGEAVGRPETAPAVHASCDNCGHASDCSTHDSGNALPGKACDCGMRVPKWTCGPNSNLQHVPELCAASLWCQADPFVHYVANLHAEKHAVYGDSWKRRGELGILGNIARKVDRIGQGGAGDTATDTVVDMLVYLVKYRLWLTDEKSAPSPVEGAYPWLLSDMVEPVTEMLQKASGYLIVTEAAQMVLPHLKDLFARLEKLVGVSTGAGNPGAIVELVDLMIRETIQVARRLWLDDQAPEGAAMDRFLGHA